MNISDFIDEQLSKQIPLRNHIQILITSKIQLFFKLNYFIST